MSTGDEPVRIYGLDVEPVRDFRTQHTRQAGVYRALDADPRFRVLGVGTPSLPRPLLRLIQLAYFVLSATAGERALACPGRPFAPGLGALSDSCPTTGTAT